MGALDVVRLTSLMQRGLGRPEIVICLIDGPVFMSHPDLEAPNIREVSGKQAGACSRATSVACTHGTFVAGVLCARRSSNAPAICPGCTLLVRPIFSETASANGAMPSATADELAAAVVDAVNARARVINLSAALIRASSIGEQKLQDALNYATARGVITVAAAGNQGMVGGSAITGHPWVIPVAACDLHGKPLSDTNLGGSIGRRGLRAPGEGVTSLGANGESQSFGGTSAAAPIVTGAIALLWSEFPNAPPAQIKLAVTRSGQLRRENIVPPLLDAWAAYRAMANSQS